MSLEVLSTPPYRVSTLLPSNDMTFERSRASSSATRGGALCVLQEGTPLGDKIFAAVPTEDGSFILAGYTEGDWGSSGAGGSDFAVVELTSNGTVSWRWQVSTFLQTYSSHRAAGNGRLNITTFRFITSRRNSTLVPIALS